MELDDLNDILKQTAIRELIDVRGFAFQRRQNNDPFRRIKIRCFWIFVFFVAGSIIFIPFLLEKNNTISVLLYLTLCIEPIISLTGYLQTRSIENARGNIKHNLLLRIRRLKFIFKSYIFLNAILYILMACVLEWLIDHEAVYNSASEKIALPVRLLFYVSFIGFQYWQKRRSYQKNYGLYLSSLTHLLTQTDED